MSKYYNETSTIQMLKLFQDNIKKDIHISTDVLKEAEEKIKSFDLNFQSLRDSTKNLSADFKQINNKCNMLNKSFGRSSIASSSSSSISSASSASLISSANLSRNDSSSSLVINSSPLNIDETNSSYQHKPYADFVSPITTLATNRKSRIIQKKLSKNLKDFQRDQNDYEFSDEEFSINNKADDSDDDIDDDELLRKQQSKIYVEQSIENSNQLIIQMLLDSS